MRRRRCTRRGFWIGFCSLERRCGKESSCSWHRSWLPARQRQTQRRSMSTVTWRGPGVGQTLWGHHVDGETCYRLCKLNPGIVQQPSLGTPSKSRFQTWREWECHKLFGGQVSILAGMVNCPNGISNFYTHGHDEGVPVRVKVVATVAPTCIITISALTVDLHKSSSRQSHTIFLSATQNGYTRGPRWRECGRREMLRFMNTKMARWHAWIISSGWQKCTVMKWRMSAICVPTVLTMTSFQPA